jgi:hypothetical protein
MRISVPQIVRRFAVVGGICVLGLASGAIGAYASHTFTDVPDTNPFHDEIDWLTQKGITTGFGDGTYRPGNPVTRQAMAAFLNRLDNGSPIELEPNNSIATADLYATQAGVVTGTLRVSNPDYWRFSHPGGGYVSALTYGLDCADQNKSNIDLTLFDAEGNELQTESGFGNFCSTLFRQPLTAGDYYMRVSTTGTVPWYGLLIEVSDQET